MYKDNLQAALERIRVLEQQLAGRPRQRQPHRWQIHMADLLAPIWTHMKILAAVYWATAVLIAAILFGTCLAKSESDVRAARVKACSAACYKAHGHRIGLFRYHITKDSEYMYCACPVAVNGRIQIYDVIAKDPKR